MTSHEEEDYDSSDDEDYVPEDVVEDEGEGLSDNEIDEVTGDDGSVISGKRRRGTKTKPTEERKEDFPSTSSADADDIFAQMMNMANNDPLLKGASDNSTTKDETNIASCSEEPSAKDTVDPVEDEVSVPVESEKKVITEVFDFAGDEVKIEREVTLKEAEKLEEKEKTRQVDAKPTKRMGLTGALTMLAKKPKMSVLDKSGHDWTTFKRDNRIEEDLETFNKGKNGYLNKQDFLSRADYRQFENEKSMRNARRKPQ